MSRKEQKCPFFSVLSFTKVPFPNIERLILKNFLFLFCKNNAALALLCFCMQPLLILLLSVELRMRLDKTAFGRFTAE